MNRRAAAAALAGAGALFAAGFALGSGGDDGRAPSGPKRAAPDGGSPAIVSLRDVAAIPALPRPSPTRRAAAGTGAAATTASSSSGAGAPSSLDSAAPSSGQAASPRSSGSGEGESSSTTKSPVDDPPVRHRSTE